MVAKIESHKRGSLPACCIHSQPESGRCSNGPQRNNRMSPKPRILLSPEVAVVIQEV